MLEQAAEHASKRGIRVRRRNPNKKTRKQLRDEARESILGNAYVNIEDFYTLKDELGAGAFGVTYLALDNKTAEEVAVKIIAKRKMSDERDREGLRNEVKILKHLSGITNIAGLLDAFEDSYNVYIVMEMCSGGELFDRIVERGQYTEKDAADCFRNIMSTIAQCHKRGVIHRDLKPENFVLKTRAEDSAIKAIDFGLSTFFEKNQSFTELVGTPLYIAPEVINGDYREVADVWSAGVILYILLSGVPPFWAPTEEGIFEEVKACRYEMRVDEGWGNISDSAKEVVKMCLNPDPRSRVTASVVLRHPWVREKGVARADSLINTDVLARMKQFATANKFKKMGLMAMAKTLSQEEIAGLKGLFQEFDTDNSGTITVDELQKGLAKTGAVTASDEIKTLMQDLDADGSGLLDYEEFTAAMVSMTKTMSHDNLARAFAYFDADGSGYISMEELRQVMVDFKLDKKGMDVGEMLKAVDTNGDGFVDYDEFLEMMTKQGN